MTNYVSHTKWSKEESPRAFISHGIATAVSFTAIIVFVSAFLFSIVPPLVSQTSTFIEAVPGLVRDVLVKQGDIVARGTSLVLLEAMKMELRITAGHAGTVSKIYCTPGQVVERGQVLVKPGSVKPHKKFKAEAYILTKEEGGRHTPFFTGYRPQFYFRTTDVTGVVTLPKGTEMVMPGDNVTIEGELITPIAMEKEVRFAIREGGRTVGAGVITEIVE